MTLTGTITDFDSAGLFGLVLADEGVFFPFNLRETPPALLELFEVGRRIRFTTCASGSTMRAIELVPLDPGGRRYVTQRNSPGEAR
jgi:hypothetical protein